MTGVPAHLRSFHRVLPLRRGERRRDLACPPVRASDRLRLSDDRTIYAERVNPALSANWSIASIWLCRAVILTRTVFSTAGSTLTTNTRRVSSANALFLGRGRTAASFLVDNMNYGSYTLLRQLPS